MKNQNSDNNEKIIEFPKTSSVSENRNYRKPQRFVAYFAFAVFLVMVLFLAVNSDSSFKSTNAINSDTITLSGANNFNFASYKEGYVLAKDGKISCYNTNQELQWETTGSKTTPAVKISDKYVLTYYNDDKLAVVTDGKKERKINTTGNVKYGYVNKNGYTVLFLEESGLKNKITVYNNVGDMLYYRDNPNKQITYAMLSNDNQSLITIELITTGENISSELVITNIKKNKTNAKINFEGLVPGGAVMVGTKEAAIIFENKVLFYSLGGKLKRQITFEGDRIYRFAYDNDIFAFIFNEDDSSNTGSKIVFYNLHGKKTGEYQTSSKARDIHLSSGKALLTLERELAIITSKGKFISSATMNYDMKDTVFISNANCALTISSAQEARLFKVE